MTKDEIFEAGRRYEQGMICSLILKREARFREHIALKAEDSDDEGKSWARAEELRDLHNDIQELAHLAIET